MMKQKPNKEIEVLEDNIREALTKLESDTKKVKTNSKADCRNLEVRLTQLEKATGKHDVEAELDELQRQMTLNQKTNDTKTKKLDDKYRDTISEL